MNKTPNFALNQWESTDRILMADFNGDNAKIDAALQAEKTAREALAAAVAKCGNCQLWTTTYTGSGSAGAAAKNRVTFPGKPAIAFVIAPDGSFMLIRYGAEFCMASILGRSYAVQNALAWEGNTAVWSSGANYPDCQMSVANTVYTVIAFLAADQ